MKVGISTFAYSWSIGIPAVLPVPMNPLTAIDFLKCASRLGFHLVQFGDNLPLHELGGDKLAELRRFAFDNNVAVQVGARGLRDDIIERYLELAEYFSSDILRIVIDLKGFEPSIEKIIKELKVWGPKAGSKNVIIAVENHDRFGSESLVAILDAVNSPYVGICLDTANSFGAQEGPEWVIEKLAPYTVNVHIKDFTIHRLASNLGFIIEGAPAGLGFLDMNLLLKHPEIREKTAILELWTPPEATIDETIEKELLWVRKSTDYLRTIFEM
jgi:sugar phosphate isomerase/epimerase